MSFFSRVMNQQAEMKLVRVTSLLFIVLLMLTVLILPLLFFHSHMYVLLISYSLTQWINWTYDLSVYKFFISLSCILFSEDIISF